jgi:hypothetical protein
MKATIKDIGDGKPYHIQFKNTKIYKRIYGKEEYLIDEYNYNKRNENISEIIYQVPISRGFLTCLNFNQVERLEQLGVIDYHKNIFFRKFAYEKNEEVEYVTSQATDGMPISLTIQKNKVGYMADILITYNDWYFRIHLEKPTNNSF